MTTNITLNPNTNIGTSEMKDGSPIVILDALLVQDCKIVFPKLPTVAFALQTIALPTIGINEVKQPTRYVDANEVGEKVKFEPFTLSFIVDKYMKNWSEIFNWMKRITANGSNVGEVDEPTLIVGNKPSLKFIGAWPTSLSGMSFDTTNPQAEYVICQLSLNYDYVDFVGTFTTSDSSYK